MKDKKRGFFYSLFRGLNLIRLIILNLIFFFCLFLVIAGIYKYNDDKGKAKNSRITVYADSLLLINPAGRLTNLSGGIICCPKRHPIQFFYRILPMRYAALHMTGGLQRFWST